MLVLSRKRDEDIQIVTKSGEVIRVRLNYIDGKSVKLGIDAPKSVKVLRGELAKEVFSKGQAPTTESGD